MPRSATKRRSAKRLGVCAWSLRVVTSMQLSSSSATLSQCRKARQRYRAFLVLLGAQWMGLEVHATHAAARRHSGAGGRLLRQLGYHDLGGDQERRIWRPPRAPSGRHVLELVL